MAALSFGHIRSGIVVSLVCSSTATAPEGSGQGGAAIRRALADRSRASHCEAMTDTPRTTAEAIGRMPGRDLLQAVIDGKLPPASISTTLHFDLVEVEDGRVVFEGRPGPDILNPQGMVHGGWALTL